MKYLSQINVSPETAHKLLIIGGIIIGAFIIRFLFSIIFTRWQKSVVSHTVKKRAYYASSVETKFTIVHRMFNVTLYFIAIMLILLQFKAVRHLGTALLASAGVAGIIVGLAAQSTLSNLLAGLYISFSQPVRLGDAVIFEGDWGWVEEITLMHIIIRTWDNRRVITANSIFVSKVIQNWDLKDSSLLGVVMLYVDYTCDVEQVRGWLTEIINESKNSTEERVASLQVVDFTEKCMVLRAFGKGPDSPKTWDLRCEIREKLIKKFQEAGMPLPKFRVDGHVMQKVGV